MLTKRNVIVSEKGWGNEELIVNKDYCGKKMLVKAGHKGSLHFHRIKNETFYLLSGCVEIEILNTFQADYYSIILEEGDILDIPNHTIHRIIGSALMDSILFEFSTKHFDDDSYRVSKGDSQL